MAILAPLFAMLGRFAGRVVNALLGWATILLFGRVDPKRQTVLGFVAIGSLIWVAAIIGFIVPDVGTLLVAAVPRPGWVEDTWVRWAMLGLVVLLPLVVGAVGVWFMRADARPAGAALVLAVLRGYPFTAVLALTIAFLAIVALSRRLRAMSRRWEDVHLPVIVQPDGYDAVVRTLRASLADAGVDTVVRPAPRLVSVPPRLLDRVAGQALGGLVPDQLVLLVRSDSRDPRVPLRPRHVWSACHRRTSPCRGCHGPHRSPRMADGIGRCPGHRGRHHPGQPSVPRGGLAAADEYRPSTRHLGHRVR